MKSLSTLIKLQKTRVDEQRHVVAKLEDKLAELDAAMTKIEIEKAREQLAAQENPEAGSTLGAYIRVLIQKERVVGKERQAVARAAELARDHLVEMFEEQKRYEIAEENRRENEAKEELRKETAELDEVGSVRFTRDKD